LLPSYHFFSVYSFQSSSIFLGLQQGRLHEVLQLAYFGR
jgi:hypothetical protein